MIRASATGIISLPTLELTSAPNGIIVPKDGVVNIGTPENRLGTIYCTNFVGSIEDPSLEVDVIRWPSLAPFDLRLRRVGTSIMELDNNAGGSTVFNVVGTIQQNGVPITSLTGDLSGPASSTDNYIPLFDGTTGKKIKQSSNIWWDSALAYLRTPDIWSSGAVEANYFVATTPVANGVAFLSKKEGDAVSWFTMHSNDKRFQFSSGSGAIDTWFGRTAAGTIKFGSTGTATVEADKLTVPTTSGEVFTAGDLVSASVASPVNINLGGTGSATVSADSLKLKLWSVGAGTTNNAGIGAAIGSRMFFQAPTGWIFDFRFGGTGTTASISSTTLRVPGTIDTAGGDLTLAPAGSNVSFSSKNLTNVSSITATGNASISGNMVAGGQVRGKTLYQQGIGQGDFVQFSNGNTSSAGASNITFNAVSGPNSGIMVMGFNRGLGGGGEFKYNPDTTGWLMGVDQRYGGDNWFYFNGSKTGGGGTYWQCPPHGRYMELPLGLRTTSIRATDTTGGTIDFNGATLTNCTVSGSGSGSPITGTTNLVDTDGSTVLSTFTYRIVPLGNNIFTYATSLSATGITIANTGAQLYFNTTTWTATAGTCKSTIMLQVAGNNVLCWIDGVSNSIIVRRVDGANFTAGQTIRVISNCVTYDSTV